MILTVENTEERRQGLQGRQGPKEVIAKVLTYQMPGLQPSQFMLVYLCLRFAPNLGYEMPMLRIMLRVSDLGAPQHLIA